MPEIRSKRMAQTLQKPVFALPGCQRMSVNTLDTLGLAEFLSPASENRNGNRRKIATLRALRGRHGQGQGESFEIA